MSGASWDLTSLGRGWWHLACGAAVIAWCVLGAAAASEKIPEQPTSTPNPPQEKPIIKQKLAFEKLARPKPPAPSSPKAAAPKPKPAPQPAPPKPPKEVDKAPSKPPTPTKTARNQPVPKPQKTKAPAQRAQPRAHRPSPIAQNSLVQIQSNAWGRRSGPVVSVELPGSSAGLKAFAVAHGAGFALSKRVAGNRARVVALLSWQGDRLVARGLGERKPGWLSWTPRLLVDARQLRNIGNPAASRGERGLLTQIFIRGGALGRGVETALRDAGVQGETRKALLKGAAGRPVTCRGQRNGSFECRLMDGRGKRW